MPIWLITVKNLLINHLKGAAIKAAFFSLFKSAAFSGFRLWLIKTIVNEFFEEIAEPIIKNILLKAQYSYHKVEGKILIKRLKEAGNNEDYDSATDDIFK